MTSWAVFVASPAADDARALEEAPDFEALEETRDDREPEPMPDFSSVPVPAASDVGSRHDRTIRRLRIATIATGSTAGIAAILVCIGQAYKGWFRVVEFSVLSNHLHLIVEAEDRRALSRGMQGLKIRLARRLNGLFGRKGTLFTERYHARQIRTPRQARATLAYVLNNYRRHAAQQGRQLPKRWIDPFSSAPFFGGWAGETVTTEEYVGEDVTSDAVRWVLRSGWKRTGLLQPGVVPGPAP